MTEPPTPEMMDDTGETTVGPDPMKMNSSDIHDCSDLPNGSPSGIYATQHGDVFCDMDTDGGNWTVFQRRNADLKPHENFQLGWKSYQVGFGSLTGEHWLGLDFIHELTKNRSRRYELRVDLEYFDGTKSYALYQRFRILSEQIGYRLVAFDYSGTAGDHLMDLKNSLPKFSTTERDNLDKETLAQIPHENIPACGDNDVGAWWRHICISSNLNGRHNLSTLLDESSFWRLVGLEGGATYYGVYWSVKERMTPLKRVEMKIRPTVHFAP